MDNVFYIIICAAFAAVAVVAIKEFINLPTKEQIKKVKEWLLYAVTIAEQKYGDGTGEIKLRFVYNLFVEKFPWIAKIVSFETFSGWVDSALDKLKELLSTNGAVATLIKKEE